MAVDQRQTVAGHSSDQRFQPTVFSCPFFDFPGHVNRHIDSSRLALHFEGQTPGDMLAGGMPHPDQGAFHEGADFSQLFQLGRAFQFEPVFDGFCCFHANQYKHWLIYVNKKNVPKNLFSILRDARRLFRRQQPIFSLS